MSIPLRYRIQVRLDVNLPTSQTQQLQRFGPIEQIRPTERRFLTLADGSMTIKELKDEILKNFQGRYGDEGEGFVVHRLQNKDMFDLDERYLVSDVLDSLDTVNVIGFTPKQTQNKRETKVQGSNASTKSPKQQSKKRKHEDDSILATNTTTTTTTTATKSQKESANSLPKSSSALILAESSNSAAAAAGTGSTAAAAQETPTKKPRKKKAADNNNDDKLDESVSVPTVGNAFVGGKSTLVPKVEKKGKSNETKHNSKQDQEEAADTTAEGLNKKQKKQEKKREKEREDRAAGDPIRGSDINNDAILKNYKVKKEGKNESDTTITAAVTTGPSSQHEEKDEEGKKKKKKTKNVAAAKASTSSELEVNGSRSEADDEVMAGLAARRAIQSSRAPRKINNDAVVRLLQSKEPETLTEEEKRELKLAERRKREKEYRDAVRKAKTDLKSDDPTTVLEARTFLDTPRRRGRPGVTSNTGVNPTMETGNDVKTMGKVKMDDEPVTSSKKAASATSIPSNKSRPSSSSSSSDGGNDSSSDSDSD